MNRVSPDAPVSLKGQVCLVTGATSGIGRVAAIALAGFGAKALLVGRNRESGEAAVAEIKARDGEAEFLPADFSSMASVRQLADTVRARHARLHALINNAGIANAARQLTPDGLEETFAVNHLAPFLLTALLHDPLTAGHSARIVNVSSQAHTMLNRGLDFDNLQGERRYKPILAYAQSKLANVLFTYELHRRLKGSGVTANCLHPGVIKTNIWRQNRGILRLIVGLMWPFMATSEQGARPLIRLAAAPELRGVSGRYFHKEKDVPSSPASYDEAAAKRLWEVSAELCGLEKS